MCKITFYTLQQKYLKYNINMKLIFNVNIFNHQIKLNGENITLKSVALLLNAKLGPVNYIPDISTREAKELDHLLDIYIKNFKKFEVYEKLKSS